jgi:hypothetical protein
VAVWRAMGRRGKRRKGARDGKLRFYATRRFDPESLAPHLVHHHRLSPRDAERRTRPIIQQYWAPRVWWKGSYFVWNYHGWQRWTYRVPCPVCVQAVSGKR